MVRFLTLALQSLFLSAAFAARALEPRNLGNPTTSSSSSMSSPTSTSSAPAQTTSSSGGGGGGGGGGGPTSSPLLFFVALGFGVVFTNLWIIVGVKYCFRYNQRNRALRNGGDVDPIDLGAIPRTHRRRREKKLMTMDEMNEKFPLITYKEWKASRAEQGLPTEGGIAPESASKSRPASVRDADGAIEAAGSPRPSHEAGGEAEAKTLAAGSLQQDEKSTGSIMVSAPSSPTTAPVRPLSAAATEQAPEDPNPSSSEDRPTSSQSKAPTITLSSETVNRVETTDTDALDEDEDDKQIREAEAAPAEHHESGDICSICLEVIEDQHQVRGLTCGHAFHADCVDPWFTVRRAMCPLCKHDYYVPKPRPEGADAAEAERLARRGQRVGPAPPQYAFMGGRGGMNPFRTGRFMAVVYHDDRPRVRGGRFQTIVTEFPSARVAHRNGPNPENPPGNPASPLHNTEHSGFWSRVSNFGLLSSSRPAMPSLHLPSRLRRGDNAQSSAGTDATAPGPAETTPGELEAGRAQT